MSEVEFKVGDLVYCPHLTTNILQVVASENSPNLVAIESGNQLIDITTDGKVWNKQGLVNDIFPATQQNYELLSQLYPNVEFEPPPKRKEPREIIEAMLESGWYRVPIIENGTMRFIDYTLGLVDDWRYTYPFDPKTGKTIIDFVDGEVVLESEDD